jgi:hypothetical protein
MANEWFDTLKKINRRNRRTGDQECPRQDRPRFMILASGAGPDADFLLISPDLLFLLLVSSARQTIRQPLKAARSG